MFGADGTQVYDSTVKTGVPRNILHWPSPLQEEAYALTDFPRFRVPAWGPTPIPADAEVDESARFARRAGLLSVAWKENHLRNKRVLLHLKG